MFTYVLRTGSCPIPLLRTTFPSAVLLGAVRPSTLSSSYERESLLPTSEYRQHSSALELLWLHPCTEPAQHCVCKLHHLFRMCASVLPLDFAQRHWSYMVLRTLDIKWVTVHHVEFCICTVHMYVCATTCTQYQSHICIQWILVNMPQFIFEEYGGLTSLAD